jgi:hypothetical protein
MSGERKAKSPALAAFLILLGTGVAFYFLPRIMIALGDVSPWLAGIFGTLLVLGFFLLFWLRARYQRNHEN